MTHTDVVIAITTLLFVESNWVAISDRLGLLVYVTVMISQLACGSVKLGLASEKAVWTSVWR